MLGAQSEGPRHTHVVGPGGMQRLALCRKHRGAGAEGHSWLPAALTLDGSALIGGAVRRNHWILHHFVCDGAAHLAPQSIIQRCASG